MTTPASSPGTPRPEAPVALVLDTNVVLDMVVFADPGVEHVAVALRCGAATAVTTTACLDELRRVLAYPQFELDAAAQDQAFERYRAQIRLIEAPDSLLESPRCADSDDQKFFDLASHAGAQFLLTKDKALLGLARAGERAGFRILHPARFSLS